MWNWDRSLNDSMQILNNFNWIISYGSNFKLRIMLFCLENIKIGYCNWFLIESKSASNGKYILYWQFLCFFKSQRIWPALQMKNDSHKISGSLQIFNSFFQTDVYVGSHIWMLVCACQFWSECRNSPRLQTHEIHQFSFWMHNVHYQCLGSRIFCNEDYNAFHIRYSVLKVKLPWLYFLLTCFP